MIPLGEDEVGPNFVQVSSYLQHLTVMPERERATAKSLPALGKAAFGKADMDAVELAMQRTYGRRAETWLSRLTGAIPDTSSWHSSTEFSLLTHNAAVGIVLAGALEPHQFAQMYGGMQLLVPIQDLGQGLAPMLPKVALTAYGRFVTRAWTLEPDRWNEVIEISIDRDIAVGSVSIEVDDIKASIATKLRDGSFDNLTKKRVAEAVRSFQETVGRWIYSSSPREAERLAYDALAALIGLHVLGNLSPQQFTRIYLPFSGAIPTDTLSVG